MFAVNLPLILTDISGGDKFKLFIDDALFIDSDMIFSWKR